MRHDALPRTVKRLALALVLVAALGCSDDADSSGAGGSGSGGGGGSTATTTPTVCDYPAPATGEGVEIGQTLPEALSWTGFAPGAAAAGDVSITALHDCDGTHGVHALLLSTLQPETAASANHAVAVREALAEWQTQGITVAFLLLNDPDGTEVTVEGVAAWRASLMLEDDVYVLADPDFLLVSGGQVNTPQNTVVDPRTMQVVAIAEGHPFDASELEATAAANAP